MHSALPDDYVPRPIEAHSRPVRRICRRACPVRARRHQTERKSTISRYLERSRLCHDAVRSDRSASQHRRACRTVDNDPNVFRQPCIDLEVAYRIKVLKLYFASLSPKRAQIAVRAKVEVAGKTRKRHLPSREVGVLADLHRRVGTGLVNELFDGSHRCRQRIVAAGSVRREANRLRRRIGHHVASGCDLHIRRRRDRDYRPVGTDLRRQSVHRYTCRRDTGRSAADPDASRTASDVQRAGALPGCPSKRREHVCLAVRHHDPGRACIEGDRYRRTPVRHGGSIERAALQAYRRDARERRRRRTDCLRAIDHQSDVATCRQRRVEVYRSRKRLGTEPDRCVLAQRRHRQVRRKRVRARIADTCRTAVADGKRPGKRRRIRPYRRKRTVCMELDRTVCRKSFGADLARPIAVNEGKCAKRTVRATEVNNAVLVGAVVVAVHVDIRFDAFVGPGHLERHCNLKLAVLGDFHTCAICAGGGRTAPELQDAFAGDRTTSLGHIDAIAVESRKRDLAILENLNILVRC